MTEPEAPRILETEGHSARAQRCLVCGSSSPVPPGPRTVEGSFEVLRCPECGLGRTWPALPADRMAGHYPERYYGKENVRFNVLFEFLTRLFRRRRARVLSARVPRGPVLDVGCGRGFLLHSLLASGFTCRGLELSDTASWHARHRLGLEVETGDLLTAPYAAEQFHAVIFWHTLEHLPHPTAAVARARDLLKPGGLIAVAVPNFDSLQARLFGKHWFHLDLPRHYFHFGTRALETLLTRHRFRIVKCDHFCLEQNPFGWLQSVYNALGFEPNFLYSVLKNRSARTSTIRQHPFQATATVVLLGPFLILSLALTVLEACLRRGGTIEVYALKE